MIPLLIFTLLLRDPSPADGDRVPTGDVPAAITQTFDESGLGQCYRLRAPVGARIELLCTLNAEGRARRCEIVDPTARARSFMPYFDCMAGLMRWQSTDGGSLDGIRVHTRIRVPA